MCSGNLPFPLHKKKKKKKNIAKVNLYNPWNPPNQFVFYRFTISFFISSIFYRFPFIKQNYKTTLEEHQDLVWKAIHSTSTSTSTTNPADYQVLNYFKIYYNRTCRLIVNTCVLVSLYLKTSRKQIFQFYWLFERLYRLWLHLNTLSQFIRYFVESWNEMETLSFPHKVNSLIYRKTDESEAMR